MLQSLSHALALRTPATQCRHVVFSILLGGCFYAGLTQYVMLPQSSVMAQAPLAATGAEDLSTSPTETQETDAQKRERLTAEKFLQVLMRRPRMGTSLDRVYGYHVQNNSLDKLIQSLTVESAESDTAGPKTMILGLVHLQRGQPALASEVLAKAESMLPRDAMCSFYLGRSLQAVGQTEKAAAAFENAIDRKPLRNEALPIFTELGRLYGRAGQSKKALAVWEKLEALFPGDPRVGGQIARTLADDGFHQEAFDRYQKLAASARKQEDKIAFAVRAAQLRRKLGEPDQATADLEKILDRLRPGSWLYTDVRNRIEEGFLRSGDYDALAQYYEKRIEKDADNLPLQIRLGRILVSAGRLDDAEKALATAIERAPDDVDVRLTLVDVLIKKDKIKDASKQYETLAKLDPKNPDYLIRWGQVVLEDKDVAIAARREAAAKIWTRLAEARSEDAVTLSQVADKMRSIEQNDRAIKLYQQAIDTDPNSAQYREYLGEFLFEIDRKEEAIEAWQAIAAGDRRNRESLVRLAEVFGTFKLNERALKTWQAAAELDLDFAQELRFVEKLRDAKQFETANQRLAIAEEIAQTPDELEQLLRERIETFQQSGTLSEQIRVYASREPTGENLRQLALMQQAAGQLTDAATAIDRAMKLSPKDVAILSVAADIAERQNRFSDAAALFEKLSDIDSRFRGNYLQRVANLQVRLGQIDDALKTCETLIDANPASTESYQFLARLAIKAGRNEQAVASLRRAMNVAPRDNAPRRLLASTFASNYQTDQAIELYWQAMRYERAQDDKIDLIRSLAPLYDRQGDMEQLLQRIDEIGREESDSRLTLRMISAAHESVEDYGAARETIGRLLDQQPRDVALLESMVRLCDAANELTLACDYQERVTQLADTPENRFKLVSFQLDAGVIDVEEALSNRIALVGDPGRLNAMIRSAVARSDTKTAAAICRAALAKDDSLWDIKLMLSQLLILESKTQEDPKESLSKARQLASDVLRESVQWDAKPPSSRPPKKATTSRVASRVNSGNPMYWGQGAYNLGRLFGMGVYGGSQYANYRSASPLVAVTCYGHARIVANAMRLICDSWEMPTEKRYEWFEEQLAKDFTPTEIDQITDPNVIWESVSMRSMALLFTKTSSFTTTMGSDSKLAMDLGCRLAELDPEYGVGFLSQILSFRMPAMRKRMKASNQPVPEIEPLTDEQLDRLENIVRQSEKPSGASTSTGSSISQRLSLYGMLSNEFEIAGQPERAEAFEPTIPDDAGFEELFAAVAYFARAKESERLDDLISKMLPAIRDDQNVLSKQLPSFSWQSIQQSLGEFPEPLKKHRTTMLDCSLALRARQQTFTRRSSTLSSGNISTYSIGGNGVYRQIQLKGPLSTRLLDDATAGSLTTLLPDDAIRGTNVIVPDEIIEHLLKPNEGATPSETKTRMVLAAFSHWWRDEPAICYEILNTACERFPDDVDLQIERARLANELGQPGKALELLDGFDPMDSKMLVRKEMAAMNLAAKLGDQARAAKAGERLYGMRMDSTTQLALADQLRRLGMADKSQAILQRMRGGKSRDAGTELQIANALASAGDKDAAAEVAYTLLRRLGTGRGQNTQNNSSYRRSAVSLLKSADRLEPVIANAERRLKASPKSLRVRSDLAELYSAAGRASDANKLWENVDDSQAVTGRQLLSMAKALSSAKKYKESAMKFLDAFEKDPSLLGNEYYSLRSAVQQAKCYDEMFQRLAKMDTNAMPYYRVGELLRLGENSEFSKSKRAFAAKIFQSEQVRSNAGYVLRNMPSEEIKKIPEIRNALVEAATSDNAFTFQSSLWRVNSYSSNGVGRGSLQNILDLVRNDKEAEQEFREAASKALEKALEKAVNAKKADEKKANEETAKNGNARFLPLLLDLYDSTKRDVAAKELFELTDNMFPRDKPLEFSGPARRTVTAGDSDDSKVTSGLLWQAGQLIEEIDEIPRRPELLVAIYKAAVHGDATGQTNFEYTPMGRLIHTYIENDQAAEARGLLMRAYRDCDYSSQNISNPGYGDYQELQAKRSIAMKLHKAGYSIDAVMIYRRLCSQPSKFTAARRWGGRTDVSQFQKLLSDTKRQVNAKKAELHIQAMIDDVSKLEAADELVLVDGSVDVTAEDGGSGFAMAIRLAKETESGRAKLESLLEQVNDQLETSSHWSLPAAAMMLAAELDESQINEHAESLFKRLPTFEEIESEGETKGSKKYQSLIQLFVVAKAIANLESDVLGETPSRLLEYVSMVAKTTGDVAATVAAASLGQGDSTLATLLDSIESAKRPGQSLPNEQVMSCLSLAKNAAATGDYELSARGLSLALGDGPPLKPMETGSSDPFTIATSSRNYSVSRSSNKKDDSMAELTDRVLEITGLYEAALEVKNEGSGSSRKPMSEKDVVAVANALRTIVLPGSRTEAYPYAKMVGTNFNDPFGSSSASKAASAPKSALGTLGKCVAKTKDAAPLIKELQLRRKAAVNKGLVDSALITVAIAVGDSELLTDSITAFAESLDGKLPAFDAKPPEAPDRRVITTQMMSETAEKTNTVNAIVRTLWPMIDPAEEVGNGLSMDSSSERTMVRLLQRTVNLIHSDFYTSSRNRQLADRLGALAIERSLSWDDASGFQEMYAVYRETIRQRYARSGDRQEEYVHNALSKLLADLSGKGGIEKLTPMLREVLAKQPEAKRRYDRNNAARMLLDIHALDDDLQFSVLQEITFGVKADARVGFFSGIVRHSAPPELVRQLTPRYSEIEALPTFSKNFPFTSSLLLLSNVANRVGKLEEVVSRLDSLSKSPFDDAALASTLVRLAACKNAPEKANGIAVDTLSHLKESLAQNSPTKSGANQQIPELATMMAVCSAERGVDTALVHPVLRELKTYALRGRRNRMASGIAILISQLGKGRTANGTIASPLKHFENVPIPSRYHPDEPRRQPRYKFDESGVLSGTGGYGKSLLMLRYPVTGQFRFSAKIADGSWGESDVSYGGVLFQPAGWSKKAVVSAVGDRGSMTCPAPSMKHNQTNVESVRVESEKVVGACNGKDYMTVEASGAFPFLAFTHPMQNTSQVSEIKLSGKTTIPRELSLISPTLRGWTSRTSSRAMVDAGMPLADTENRGRLKLQRVAEQKALKEKPLDGKWCVFEDQIRFEQKPVSGRTQTESSMQYLRPIFDGETVTLTFWWEQGRVELYPTLGQTALVLSSDGMRARWMGMPNDLASLALLRDATLPDAKEQPTATDVLEQDVLLKDKSWNTLAFQRKADKITISLNEKSVIELPADNMTRFGVMRPKERAVKIKSVMLTGDWPETLPEDWLAPKAP